MMYANQPNQQIINQTFLIINNTTYIVPTLWNQVFHIVTGQPQTNKVKFTIPMSITKFKLLYNTCNHIIILLHKLILGN